MDDFERKHALNTAIDRLIDVVRQIRIYNESAATVIDDVGDEGFEVVCSLLNRLASVEEWSGDLTAFEDLPASLSRPLEDLDYEVKTVLESFGVDELCKGGKSGGEFWIQVENKRCVIFGGRWRQSPDYWVELKDPTETHPWAKPRRVLFEGVGQFLSIDDTPFLNILTNVLTAWQTDRTERETLLLSKPIQPRAAAVFIPTPLQSAILKALDCRVLKKQALADIVSKGEGSRLYRPGGLKELVAVGKIKHTRGRGYYRPDAPPPDAEFVAPLEVPQKFPNRSPNTSPAESNPRIGD